MKYKFILDENIPILIAENLRMRGYDILSIQEKFRGLDDESIIHLSQKEERIVLTYDKDFGYLVFNQNLHPHSVILFKLSGQSLKEINLTVKSIINHLEKNKIDTANQFFVYDGKNLRNRPI